MVGRFHQPWSLFGIYGPAVFLVFKGTNCNFLQFEIWSLLKYFLGLVVIWLFLLNDIHIFLFQHIVIFFFALINLKCSEFLNLQLLVVHDLTSRSEWAFQTFIIRCLHVDHNGLLALILYLWQTWYYHILHQFPDIIDDYVFLFEIVDIILLYEF